MPKPLIGEYTDGGIRELRDAGSATGDRKARVFIADTTLSDKQVVGRGG
ncbi:hypothetical protein [Rubidibacter lacunae]|nr:hypothetical protein [Rubidibacter lacunae]